MSKSKGRKNGAAPRRAPSVQVKGYKIGARVGGGGSNYLAVADVDEVPFAFEGWEPDPNPKKNPRPKVRRLDTGEVGLLPDWGLLRVKLETARTVPNPDRAARKKEPTVPASAEPGDAFVLLTRGRERIAKGAWKGKKAVALDLWRLEK